MRKVLSLGLLAFALQGCIMSGPMALIPPTAKYFLWNSDDEQKKDDARAISVQDLLKKARGFSSDTEKPANILISYDDYVIDEERLEAFSRDHKHAFEMVCGPYEYGSPIEAATMALRTCGAIKKQLIDRGLNLNVRFDPEATKGSAVLTPFVMIEAEDA